MCDWLYHVYENLHPILQNQITEEAAFEDPHICLSRRAELDEPLLIVFEDGDVLGISFDEGSCVRAELNTIPVSIQPGINYKNFHANRLFQDIIGKTVVAFSVTATTLEPDFTWSHGLDLEEQSSYVESVSIIYADEAGWQPYHRKLRFQADLDFGEVTLMDYDDTAVKLPVTELPYILEGFPDAEYFRK